jgi:hypothetical protein
VVRTLHKEQKSVRLSTKYTQNFMSDSGENNPPNDEMEGGVSRKPASSLKMSLDCNSDETVDSEH